MRLDVLLIRRFPSLSRRKARDVIEKGQVDVDGRTVRQAGVEVAEDARVEWDVNRPAQSRARLSLPALYQDESLLIVDKPAGLLTVPTTPEADEDCVARRVREYVLHLRPRHPYAGVVHRLDRDTTGALALALDPPTREALRALFREHRVERRYVALVAGEPREEHGEIDAPIRDRYEGGRRGVARPSEPSKPARTRFRVLERFEGAALLEIEIETGRQHQIRIHLAHLRLPVLGDEVYGGALPRGHVRVPRQMLHARVLGLAHPQDGRPVRAVSPLPADFERVRRHLRSSTRSSSKRRG